MSDRRALALTERRAAFYQVLHEYPAFEAALHMLFRRVFPAVARARTPQQRERALRKVNARGTTPADDATVRAFADRWKLPRHDGETDLWSCLYHACEGAPVRLRALAPPSGATRLDTVPITLAAFNYDPRVDPGLAFEYHFPALRRAWITQARQHQARARAAFRRQLPPKFRTREQSLIVARRLYRRAVEKQSWSDIASAEGPGIDASTVRVSVEDWARRLGVPLPKKRRGRPRKS